MSAPENKRYASNWLAVFDLKIRSLDGVHTLMHESCVLSVGDQALLFGLVCFSVCGLFCTAYIFIDLFIDAENFIVVCCVECSADGRFLATGCNRTA
jgi:hypothetical protein